MNEGLSLGSAIEAGKTVIELVRWLYDPTVRLLEKYRFFYSHETRGLQEHLFPTLFYDLSSDVGTAHEKYPHKVHPDNLVAAKEISKSLTTVFSMGRRVERFANCREPDRMRNLLLIGAPKSTLLAREAMGYQKESGKLGIEPKTNLRLVFDYNEKHLEECRRIVAGELHVVPNYKLIDREKGKIYTPRTDDDAYLIEDFLLLTVMPNILSRYENKLIINAAGTHGMGTSAFALLLRDRDLLKQIDEGRKGNRYFQTVLWASEVQRGKLFYTPKKLEHILTTPIESRIF